MKSEGNRSAFLYTIETRDVSIQYDSFIAKNQNVLLNLFFGNESSSGSQPSTPESAQASFVRKDYFSDRTSQY